jgi:hypothetical protein
MKGIVTSIVVFLIVGTSDPAFAQTRGAAYAVGAVGSWSRFGAGALFGGAAGAEAVIHDLVGVGVEAGLLTSDQGGLMVSISPGASVRLRTTPGPVPYVTGGYSYLQFFEGSDHAYHFGGGVEFLKTARRALRVEFRDFVRPGRYGSAHYWTIRLGVAVR